MKTILITGINGFLGSSIAKRLSKNNIVIGTEYKLDDLFRITENDFHVYEANVQQYEVLFIENNIDIIIHTATFYGRDREDTLKMLDANLISPFHLLDFAIKNKVKLFINTDSALDRFTSIYSLTKKQFLDWLRFRGSEIKAVNMQLEHFYGPGASNTNFITFMIQKLLKNEPKIDLTLGEQKRDFVYYEDIIDAYELVVNSLDKLIDDFTHFEVGSGDTITIKELMLLMKQLTKSSTELNFGALPYRENELMNSMPDLSTIHNLGWNSKTNLNNGLIKTIETFI